MKIPTLRVLPLNQTIQVQLFSIFSQFSGGCFVPSPNSDGADFDIYIKVINRFYNFAKN